MREPWDVRLSNRCQLPLYSTCMCGNVKAKASFNPKPSSTVQPRH